MTNTGTNIRDWPHPATKKHIHSEKSHKIFNYDVARINSITMWIVEFWSTTFVVRRGLESRVESLPGKTPGGCVRAGVPRPRSSGGREEGHV